MTAQTTFDRKPVRVRRHSAVAIVPVTKRRWFRFSALAIIVSCVFVGVFTSALLAN